MFYNIRIHLIIVSVILATVFFAFDLYLPLGVAAGVPYVALVLVGMWGQSRQFILGLVTVALALTVIGYFLSSPGGLLWVVLANRVLAVLVILVTGILLVLYKKAEPRLLMLTHAIEQSPASAIITDIDGNIEYVNPKFLEVTGYSPGDVIGKNPRILRSDHTPRLEYQELWKTIGSGGEWRGKFKNKKKNGELFWESAVISPIRDTAGKITHFLALKEDITDRMRIEEALKTSEERLRAIIDHSASFIFLKDTESRILKINKVYEKFYGITEKDVVGHQGHEWLGREKAAQLSELDQTVISTKQPVETEFETTNLDGKILIIQSIRFPVLDQHGEVVGVGGIGTDITEQIKTERKAQRIASYLDLIESITWATDHTTNFHKALQFTIEKICEFSEWPVGHAFVPDRDNREILVSLPVWHLRDPAQYEPFRRHTEEKKYPVGKELPGQVLESRQVKWISDFAKQTFSARLNCAADVGLMTGFGFPVIVENEVVAVLEFYSNISVVHGDFKPDVISQITTQLGNVYERNRARETLRASEEHTKAILDNIVDGVITLDARGIIKSFSPACERIFGYSKDELIGRNISVLMPESYRNAHDGHIKTYLATGISKSLGFAREVVGQRRDGSTFPLEVSVSEFPAEMGRRFIGTLRDVTERKKLERQFREAQKLEAVGTLIGGVAHEFNNVLMGIVGHSQITMDKLPPTSEVRTNVDQILRAATHGGALVNQLVDFSRQRKTEIIREPVMVEGIVSGALALIRPSIPSSIELRWNEPALSEPVLADPTQLHQILINLCTNASDAIGDEVGVIEISVENIVIEDTASAVSPPLSPGRYVKLTVSDTGCGMDKRVQERIFEPFFTTKAVGKGSGLGLAATYGIVCDHGGVIDVQSEPGKGTTFSIFFPSTDESMQDPHTEPTTCIGGPHRILLVDDEEIIVEAIGTVLKKLGYTVSTAMSGAEALEVFRSSHGEFDLIITDQNMPGMSGLSLSREAIEIRPDIPIILCSGNLPDSVLEDLNSIGVRKVVNKPITIMALAQAISDVLITKKNLS